VKVYIVAGTRRTLHVAERTDAGVTLTAEGCNLDSAGDRDAYNSRAEAAAKAKRECARCQP
jgi:hypothetical protein